MNGRACVLRSLLFRVGSSRAIASLPGRLARIAATPNQLQLGTEPSQDKLSARAFSTCHPSLLVSPKITPSTTADLVPSVMLPAAPTLSAFVPSALVPSVPNPSSLLPRALDSSAPILSAIVSSALL